MTHGLEARCAELAAQVAELQQTFDLQWEADMRAVKRWRAAHPGNELVLPDRANMVVWLLEQHDARAQCAPWQPIESVQKNGLKVDLWCLNISDGRSTRFSGMFVNHDGKWEDLHGYILEPKWRPVYWTPIPAPPALTSTDGGGGK